MKSLQVIVIGFLVPAFQKLGPKWRRGFTKVWKLRLHSSSYKKPTLPFIISY